MASFNSMLQLFGSFVRGKRLIDGGELLTLANFFFNPNNAVKALAGGANPGTLLQYGINRVTTVASGADSVQMPPAILGAWCVVINDGANSMQIFGNLSNPNNGNTQDVLIDNTHNIAAAAATGIALANNKAAVFFCPVAGTWKALVSA